MAQIMPNKTFTFILLMILINQINTDFYNPDCTHDGFGCLNCTYRKLCGRWWFWGPLERWGVPTPCLDPLTGQSLPYCDPNTNQCVSYVPQQCSVGSCLREEEGNFYPDIGNCNRYFRCEAGVPKIEECGAGMVYKQQWRKCVVNLSSKRDCFEVTKCLGSSGTYPGDSSLYYKCAGGVVSLAACPFRYEEYDPLTESCRKKRCSTKTEVLLAWGIPYKCEAYFNCVTQREINCPIGQGFNSHTNKCTPFYNNLCNELTLLETNVKSLFGSSFIFNFLANLMNLFQFPHSVLSTTILLTDYLYRERTLPPGLINYVIQTALSLIPPQIKTILNLLPFQLPFSNHLTMDQKIALTIEEGFTNTNFTLVGETLRDAQSVPETFRIFIKYLANRLNVPQESLYGILQMVAPTLVDTINSWFGTTKIVVLKNKELILDGDCLRQTLQGQLERIVNAVGHVNGDLAAVLKAYVYEDYQFVRNIAKKVFLPLHA